MLNVLQATDVYTTSGNNLTGPGIIGGIWISLATALADMSVTAYDTTLTSGTVSGEPQLTPGTVVISQSDYNEYYLDMHNQYFEDGVYVDISTTSGTFSYMVMYDN